MTEWYVECHGNEHGPFSPPQLKELVQRGAIRPATRLRQSTDTKWFPASQVNGLFNTALQSQVSPVPPSASFTPRPLDPTSDSKSDGSPKWIWVFVGAAVVFLFAFGAYAVWDSSRKSEQARIETANREVQEAVAKANDWIQNGGLSDADEIEQALNTAAVDPVATEKTSIAPALTAFKNAKVERQAGAILKSAVEAIVDKEFDKAMMLLPQYIGHQYAKERQRAETLLAEIHLATSDDEALRTLLAVDDHSFDSLSKGDLSAVVLSHPALVETGIATLKRNLAEAGRRRENLRKLAEAERIAEQRRIDAEQKRINAERIAAQRREVERENEKREAEEKVKREMRTLAHSCPLSLVGCTFSQDVLGSPQLQLTVRNRAAQPIEAFEIGVACYNKFGDKVNAFDFGSNERNLIYQERIEAYATITPDGHWTLYGHDTARVFKFTVKRVKMADDKEWTPPEGFEDVNSVTYAEK
jgi:hypothetical protein